MSKRRTSSLVSFVAQSHIPASLIRAVVKQVGGWSSFKELASDVTNHGAGGGVSGFIYYTETVKFAKKNKDVIWTMLKEQCRDMGEDNVFSSMVHWSCLNGYSAEEIAEGAFDNSSDAHTQVANAFAWYALEEVARSYTDLIEIN